jgi:hypothetical protein
MNNALYYFKNWVLCAFGRHQVWLWDIDDEGHILEDAKCKHCDKLVVKRKVVAVGEFNLGLH